MRMRVRRLLCAALLISGLGGCATAAQRETQKIRDNTQATIARLQSCVNSVYYSPESAPIRRHLSLNVENSTLEQLTDTSKASADEIKAIYTEHPKLQECRNDEMQSLETTTPTIVPILADAYDKSDQNLIELIQQKITWGEFSTRNKAIASETRKELMAAAAQIDAGLERSHEAELARRQAAADALMRYSQTQQMINALNRPVTTNCMGTGYSVNCTTY